MLHSTKSLALWQASEESLCFHSSAMIKTCKHIYFHSYRPQRWRLACHHCGLKLWKIDTLANFIRHRRMKAGRFLRSLPQG